MERVLGFGRSSAGGKCPNRARTRYRTRGASKHRPCSNSDSLGRPRTTATTRRAHHRPCGRGGRSEAGRTLAALTLGSRAAERLDRTVDRARAALVAGRAAHLQDLRDVAMSWFECAEAENGSASTHAEAVWGQFLIADERQSDELPVAVARVEESSDGT